MKKLRQNSAHLKKVSSEPEVDQSWEGQDLGDGRDRLERRLRSDEADDELEKSL